jgi:phosphatidylglycerol:prolipoprotein diacylglycerol transferase
MNSVMAFLSYIHWNVRPELIILGPFAVRWYGMLFALGFALGFVIIRWVFRIENRPETDLDALLGYVLAGAVIGARLGHCLFYEPGYYLAHPMDIPKIWQGGLASHGGAAGVALALVFYCRRHPDQPYLWLLDRVVVPTALAGSLIRLGNLFNSEILGRPARLPWAMVFDRIDEVPRHPVQLYESAAYLLVFLLLLSVYRRYRQRTPPGWLLGIFLVTVFSFRFVLEFFKEPQSEFGQNLPVSMGQLLSIPLIIVGAWLVVARRPRARSPV